MEYINILEDWRISRDTRQAEQVRYKSDLSDVFSATFRFSDSRSVRGRGKSSSFWAYQISDSHK